MLRIKKVVRSSPASVPGPCSCGIAWRRRIAAARSSPARTAARIEVLWLCSSTGISISSVSSILSSRSSRSTRSMRSSPRAGSACDATSVAYICSLDTLFSPGPVEAAGSWFEAAGGTFHSTRRESGVTEWKIRFQAVYKGQICLRPTSTVSSSSSKDSVPRLWPQRVETVV